MRALVVCVCVFVTAVVCIYPDVDRSNDVIDYLTGFEEFDDRVDTPVSYTPNCPVLNCRAPHRKCKKRGGVKMDSMGCPTCKCRCTHVTEQHCASQCVHGYEIMREGQCSRCRCLPACPSMRSCNRRCSAGFKLDSEGCEKCQCDCPVVSKAGCKRACAFGYRVVTAADGCKSCICKVKKNKCPHQKKCPHHRRCELYGGFRRTRSGCRTCRCNCRDLDLEKCAKECGDKFQVIRKPSSTCYTCKCNAVREVETICPSMDSCKLNCDGRGGYRTYKDTGCEKCHCKCPSFRRSSCRAKCSYGYKVERHGGCEVCRCKRKPKCHGIGYCDLYCKYGMMKDHRGCKICKCRGAPVRSY